jgi:hypothetical protein
MEPIAVKVRLPIRQSLLTRVKKLFRVYRLVLFLALDIEVCKRGISYIFFHNLIFSRPKIWRLNLLLRQWTNCIERRAHRIISIVFYKFAVLNVLNTRNRTHRGVYVHIGYLSPFLFCSLHKEIIFLGVIHFFVK